MFPKATLNLQVGDKKRELEATVAFDRNAFWVLDERGTTLKAFFYTNIKIAEYTYSKSARWKTGAVGAPVLTSANGNRHWFMVQTQDDYALLYLDKDSFRSVVAAFELRADTKVETAESR